MRVSFRASSGSSATTGRPRRRGGAQKSRAAKAGDWLEKTRKAWEQTAHRALERAGRTERIDGRSLADLRDEAHRAGDLERAADFSREPNVHLGPERYRTIRGGASETVKQAGRVELLEEQVRQLVAQQDAELKGYIGWSENMAEQQGILNAHVEKLTKAYNELAQLLDEG